MSEPEQREGGAAGPAGAAEASASAGDATAAEARGEVAAADMADMADMADAAEASGAAVMTATLEADGAAESSRAAERLAVRPYDFRQPSRISKDRMRSLRAIYGLMTKALEGWMTGRVREHAELEVASLDQHSFGELVFS